MWAVYSNTCNDTNQTSEVAGKNVECHIVVWCSTNAGRFSVFCLLCTLHSVVNNFFRSCFYVGIWEHQVVHVFHSFQCFFMPCSKKPAHSCLQRAERLQEMFWVSKYCAEIEAVKTIKLASQHNVIRRKKKLEWFFSIFCLEVMADNIFDYVIIQICCLL